MRERSLVLAHQVNDVTQRLYGHLVASWTVTLSHLATKMGVLTFRVNFLNKKVKEILVFHNKVLILPLIVKKQGLILIKKLS